MTADSQAYREVEARFWRETLGRAPGERMVELPALGTRVRVMETGEGPRLLFVHGGPNAGSTWAPLLEHLEGFRCLLVDRPGCGLSEPIRRPRPSVRETMGAFLSELLTVTEEPVSGLVASSFGSFTVLSWDLQGAADPLPTVHFGCPALAPGSRTPLRFLLQALPGVRSLLIRLEPPSLATAEKGFRQIGHGTSMDRGLIPEVGLAWYVALLEHTDTRENDLKLFGRIRPRDRLALDELGRVRSPSSFFWGADDTFGGAEVAEPLAAAIPGAGLEVIPHAGHLPWLDAPERAARHVASFMAKHAVGD